MIPRSLALAAAFVFVSCATMPTPRVATGTNAAIREDRATTVQSTIVIPPDVRAVEPFAQRFATSGAPDRHVVDLAAMRFETDALVSVTASGKRAYAMPDLSSFPRQLDRFPFATGSEDYFVVQAKSPADQSALRAWLEANGTPILEYVPQLAYLVRGTEEQLTRIQERPEVFWTGLYSPAFRIDPVLDFIIESNPGQQIQIRALFDAHHHEDIRELMRQLKALGVSPKNVTRRARDWSIRISGSAVTARDLVLLPGCLWTERFVEPRLTNNTARTSQNVVTGRGASSGPIMDVEDVWARGIRGEGQVASAADTGLSTGSLATIHQDFGQSGSGTNPMRIVAGYGLGRAGNWNDDQTTGGGHGTHTSGSIVGNGFRSGSTPSTNTFPATSYAGTAPKALFVFQSIMDAGGNLDGLPGDLNTLFQQTYTDGARVHSNSWGSDSNGEYTANSQEVDQFSWLHKDMVITFSAGNSGDDTTTPGPIDGIINNDSMGAPATAKNCITVGASENYLPGFIYEYPSGDCTSSDGIEQKTWNWFNGTNFGTPPVSSDLMADNANGMGAFSSRGPTDDGRFKPDVVAPGIAIISTRTDVNQAYEQWGICPVPANLRPYYLTQGGTSMANPLTAGAATLVRQYYADGWHQNHTAVTNGGANGAHGFNPSSALVKATLINGAWDMSPGQYGTGSTREIPPGWDSGATLPNNAEGFGRVDLETSLFPGSGWADSNGRAMAVHDVTPGLTTGQSTSYTFNVGGNGDPFIATLVWTDPQAATGVGAKLVNNLDLTVVAPASGTTYYPNGVDKTSGADTLNNVEQVKVSSPASGLWTITVTGTNVPGNAENGSTTQPFALVISGVSCATVPGTPGSVTATASAANRVTVNWTAATGSPASYRIYRAGPGSACPGSGYTLIGTVSAPTLTYADTSVSGGSTYSYKVAAAAACESPLSSCSSATATGACSLPPAFAGVTTVASPNATCSLVVHWAEAFASCSGLVTYNVYRSTSAGFTPAPSNRVAMSVLTNYYSDYGVSSGTTYYYKVRAVENGIEDVNVAEQSATPVGLTLLGFTQNFDSLGAGNMAGFTTAGTGAADWRGVMACSPNTSSGNVFRFGGAACSSPYSADADTVAVINGASGVVIPAGSTTTRLSFWHRYDFEDGWDGGWLVIRRSTDVSYTNIPASAFVSGAYNDVDWWSGTANTSMANVVVDLDAACNAIPGNTGGCSGKTIFVGFFASTDFIVQNQGWFIDNVDLSYREACTACVAPAAPTGLTVTAPSSNTLRVSWTAGNPAGVGYNLYRQAGACPMTAPELIAKGLTGTTYDDTGVTGGATFHYVVRAVAVSGCESASSSCQAGTATGPILATPPNFTATASGTTSAVLSWGSVMGAATYLVERSTNNSTFTTVGITAGTWMTNTGLTPGVAYLYRVTARNVDGTPGASAKDIVTMIDFTDPRIVTGTAIKAVHLTQLRTAINAVRTLAGLGAGSYTDPTITAGTTMMKRLHLLDLRTNLDVARALLGVSAVVYTDSTITVGLTAVKATHIEELRSGTN